MNKDGKALIQVEASLNKHKLYLSTHFFLEENQWDSKRQQVINHPMAEEFNARLYSFIIELEQIEMSFWRKGIPITLALLKKSNIRILRNRTETADSRCLCSEIWLCRI